MAGVQLAADPTDLSRSPTTPPKSSGWCNLQLCVEACTVGPQHLDHLTGLVSRLVYDGICVCHPARVSQDLGRSERPQLTDSITESRQTVDVHLTGFASHSQPTYPYRTDPPYGVFLVGCPDGSTLGPVGRSGRVAGRIWRHRASLPTGQCASCR